MKKKLEHQKCSNVYMLDPVWARFHYVYWDSPYANSSQSLPVCVRESPYAYGGPHMHTFAYGDQIPNFPYAHKHIMHTVSD
jgi:hypothetical protein